MKNKQTKKVKKDKISIDKTVFENMFKQVEKIDIQNQVLLSMLKELQEKYLTLWDMNVQLRRYWKEEAERHNT